ncbi:MAG: ATP-dependent DNA helicase RecG [Deferribacterota bacterium]|nr:ATP-dependent DNA helicase RecG [Deferribacterota bacterium]
MQKNLYNLKNKLYLIKNNLRNSNPKYYLKSISDELSRLSPNLKEKLEHIDKNNVTANQIDSLLTETMPLLSDKEENNNNLSDIDIEELSSTPNKTIKYLKKFGIKSIYDLITHFPYKYDRLVVDINSNESVLKGILLKYDIVRTKSGKKMLQAFFKGQNNLYFYIIWLHFNKNYPLSLLKEGKKYCFYGVIQRFNSRPAIFHPEFINDSDINTVKPIYQLPKNIKKKYFYNLLNSALSKYLNMFEETLPAKVLNKYSYPNVSEALYVIHKPNIDENINALANKTHPAIERFIYEELLYLQLGLLTKKADYEKSKGIALNIKKQDLYSLKDFIPFPLTKSQKRVLAEIINDLNSTKQMNRLLQGDVGSGKTVIALIASVLTVRENHQVAIIAPTEVLAEQHYLNFIKYLEKSNIKIDLITGSTPKKEKSEIKEKTKSGVNGIIIGTHALIQEDILFKSLGLAVVDEQHRFGVIQRKLLMEKGYRPNMLLMTATPIPRSLALTFYGDLDISIIDEMPPGRKEVITKAYEEKDIEKVYEFVSRELKKGFKAYFIYPLISESEKIALKDATRNYEKLQNIFGRDIVGLLHGKLSANEKRELISSFKYGKIKVLVSTTVVEVGVDIKEATIMVIENAERFGLSQLHQLRGRIGRNEYQSYCLLVYNGKNLSEEARKRIEALVKCSDGFKISETDLELRGPGDFFGVKQSGLPDFKFSNIVRDLLILNRARKDALDILEDDPQLEKKENFIIKNTLLNRWSKKLELINIG